MLMHAVLAFALLETLVLAGVLIAWADRVAGARLLAAFLIGISLWMVGNELPNWLGPQTEPVMMLLLSTAPFTSALFFHFCTVFCRVDLGKWGVAAAYALGAAASGAAGFSVWMRAAVSTATASSAASACTACACAWVAATRPARGRIRAVSKVRGRIGISGVGREGHDYAGPHAQGQCADRCRR